MAALAVVGIVYGALVAMVQPDMKKLVAYSSVSHLGFVVLGLTALTVTGVHGAVYQMLAHGISTGGLFLIVGMLSDRRHTRQIAEFGGLKHVMPKLVGAFLLITLASIALPGLNGFIGEFLILVGAFQVRWWWGAFAVTGIILGAAYMLWLYQRTMFGEITKDENRKLPDLSAREMATLLPIIFFCFWIGLYPMPFLRAMRSSVTNVIQIVEKGAAGKSVAPRATAERPATQPGRPGAAATASTSTPGAAPEAVR
jgi:NADH-quinone oxidoreductase subunit M